MDIPAMLQLRANANTTKITVADPRTMSPPANTPRIGPVPDGHDHLVTADGSVPAHPVHRAASSRSAAPDPSVALNSHRCHQWQHVPIGQPGDEHSDRAPARCRPQPEDADDGAGHQARAREARQVDEEHPVGAAVGDVPLGLVVQTARCGIAAERARTWGAARTVEFDIATEEARPRMAVLRKLRTLVRGIG